MAVWIQIIGLRRLDSIKNDKEKIPTILDKINFDFDFIDVELEKYSNL